MSSTSTTTANPAPAQKRAPQPTRTVRVSAVIQRRSGGIKVASIVLIVVALFVIIRALPVDRAIDLLKSRVDGLRFWGPLALGAAYIVAAPALLA